MITIVLGGTRSGKSEVAERLAGASGAVTYVATAQVDPADEDHDHDWAARIARHQERRPKGWATVECPEPDRLPDVLRQLEGTVLVDSLGTWVTGHPTMEPDAEALVAALLERAGNTVVVSEEVGLAPHATTELGRRFVDRLGTVNQRVASVADRALLVVAGRAVELLPPGEPPC